MLTGTNLTHAKHHNLQIVHQTIRLYGPISRADVARRTELTAQTVSNLVRELLDERLIIEVDRLNLGRGAPSILLAVNPEAAYSVGLDMDIDHLSAVLVDLSGVVQQSLHHTLSEPTPEEAIGLMVAASHELVAAQGLTLEQVRGVGVGFPGPMVASRKASGTYVVSPRALPGWRNVPLADLLHERLAVPVFIENNATAAALGEHWYGAGRHVSTFFYVYLGSGLGGGLVVQGDPFEGYSGNAGEIGYLPCFSRPGLGGDLDHIGQIFSLRQILPMLTAAGARAASLDDLITLLRAESPPVMRWLDTAAEELSVALLSVEYLLDPEVIFIGGRWPLELLDALKRRLEHLLPMRRIQGKTFIPSLRLATSGTDAAALGVATLPIYSAFAPQSRISLKRSDSAGSNGKSQLFNHL